MWVSVVEAHEPLGKLAETTERIEAFAPELLGAAALLLTGVIAAWIVSWIGVRALRLWSERLAGGVGSLMGGKVEARLPRSRLDPASLRLVGRALFFLVLLVFLAGAADVVELPAVSAWALGLAQYLPRVLAAAIVVVVGVLAGGLARIVATEAAASAHVDRAGALGRLAQVVIVAVSAVVAVDQIGFEVTFLVIAVSIALAAGLGAAALAFGLGARTVVSNIVATHYLAQTYQPGQRIRVGDDEGRIAEIAPIAVVLETADGRVHIPAKAFTEQTTTLISDGEDNVASSE